MVDLHQDRDSVFLFKNSRYVHTLFLEKITSLRHWYINRKEKKNQIQIFSSELTYQSSMVQFLQNSRKCSIKETVRYKKNYYDSAPHDMGWYLTAV